MLTFPLIKSQATLLNSPRFSQLFQDFIFMNKSPLHLKYFKRKREATPSNVRPISAWQLIIAVNILNWLQLFKRIIEQHINA
jgi:hypothetical protein